MVWVVSLSAPELIPRCLIPGELVDGIRSLKGVGTLVRALALSVLYPRDYLIRDYP